MKKNAANYSTVRLLMPQWQGGDGGKSYPLGARLLAWLAPDSDAPLLEVPVTEYDGTPLPIDNGIKGREQIVRQLRAARHLLDAYQPDRIITFGGDCLVSQAPFDYLNDKYDGKLGVLWIDAHPDVTTPRDYSHAHAMVLGNLLGGGDPGLAQEVAKPILPENVLFAGVDDMQDYEAETVASLGIRLAASEQLAENSDAATQWIRERGIKHMAIHLDLDVLDPRLFRSLLFNNPNGERIDSPAGKMTMNQVTRLITDVEQAADVVGMTYAEHMPWDDINLMNMMARFSFMK